MDEPRGVVATLVEGRVCYWSRSRRKLWRKGETSGQVQLLRELRLDCDGDTVLLLVDQPGVACHTGRRSCFFRAWRGGDGWAVIAEPQIDPETLYPKEAAANSERLASYCSGGQARCAWIWAIMSELNIRLAHCELYWLTCAL